MHSLIERAIDDFLLEDATFETVEWTERATDEETIESFATLTFASATDTVTLTYRCADDMWVDMRRTGRAPFPDMSERPMLCEVREALSERFGRSFDSYAVEGGCSIQHEAVLYETMDGVRTYPERTAIIEWDETGAITYASAPIARPVGGTFDRIPHRVTDVGPFLVRWSADETFITTTPIVQWLDGRLANEPCRFDVIPNDVRIEPTNDWTYRVLSDRTTCENATRQPIPPLDRDRLTSVLAGLTTTPDTWYVTRTYDYPMETIRATNGRFSSDVTIFLRDDQVVSYTVRPMEPIDATRRTEIAQTLCDSLERRRAYVFCPQTASFQPAYVYESTKAYDTTTGRYVSRTNH